VNDMTDYPTMTPHLVLRGAAAAIDWYADVLRAKEIQRFTMPDGSIPHAELLFGDALVTLGDESPEYEQAAPRVGEPVQGALTWQVADVDAVWASAVAGGATPSAEPADSPFGGRMGTLRDPFGHRWILLTKGEPMSADEQQAAFRAMTGG
jgi:PhnB protein